MNLETEISMKLRDPRALESLFRSSDEDVFRNAILTLQRQKPDELALVFWKERLSPMERPKESGAPAKPHVGLVVTLCLLAGLYAKLPAILSFIKADTFYPANTAFFVFPAVIAYFLLTNRMSRKLMGGVICTLLFCCLYSNVLTNAFLVPSGTPSDTLVLAGMHMPFVLWALLGLAFMGDGSRTYPERIRYLSYTGETLIYSGIILFGGMILTALTMALFGIIGMRVEEWYMEWVVVLGTVSAPIVATYISTNRLALSGKISPLMAKIFAPLLLITLMVYLLALPAAGKNPFTDRDNLIVFNSMLIAVLALSIFAIVERPQRSEPSGLDKINFALVCVGLLINSIALAAILFRLASYGLTPNRLAILGSNIIVFSHAALIGKTSLSFLRGRGSMTSIHDEIARFLPAYSVWTCIVTFVFPFAFGFR